MTPVSDTVIRQMVEAIVDVSDPEQVILFGSRGRGVRCARGHPGLLSRRCGLLARLAQPPKESGPATMDA